MLDAGSLTAVILSAMAVISSLLGNVKHCESGCLRCDKEVNEKAPELVVPPTMLNKKSQ